MYIKVLIHIKTILKYTSKHATLESNYIDFLDIFRFASIVFFYIVLGVVIQKVVRKQSGVHLIPNYELWSSVPGNIKVFLWVNIHCFELALDIRFKYCE